MSFTSDRHALQALLDALVEVNPDHFAPSTRALIETACCHLLSPDPALARLRRSLCETSAALDSLDRRMLNHVGHPCEGPRGEVARARVILQETAS